MQIVIDIPEERYDWIKWGVNAGLGSVVERAVANGTVLPKHGRLIDADAVTKDLNTLTDAFVINFDKTTGKFMGIACTAPTILEAWGNEE